MNGSSRSTLAWVVENPRTDRDSDGAWGLVPAAEAVAVVVVVVTAVAVLTTRVGPATLPHAGPAAGAGGRIGTCEFDLSGIEGFLDRPPGAGTGLGMNEVDVDAEADRR